MRIKHYCLSQFKNGKINYPKMKFDIDKQTIGDLELFEKAKGDKSIFSYYNFTKSIGGKKRLENIFRNPLTDLESIQSRIQTIKCFQKLKASIEIEKECLDFIEYYLIQQNVPNRFSVSNSYFKAISYKLKPKNEYYIVRRGIRFTIDFLNKIYDYAKQLQNENSTETITKIQNIICQKIESTSLNAVLSLKKRRKLNPYEFGKLDFYFRKSEKNNLQEILEIVYEIDVFKSIVTAIDKNGLSLPVFTQQPNSFRIEGLFHPFIDNPISNDFEFIANKNLCFLTGPNMAGKSTFLKSISVSLYLSHLGFPVPAKNLETSFYNGLLTTINLADNINKGYSHFYNEVLRVKYIAERINHTGNIFVVFDELFRGTNVKDAYEASLAVISAFSKQHKGVFAISTHIIEVANKLNNNESIFFKYFEANLVNEIPQYNYRIKDGVTDERIGMYILKKEKVIETIESAAI
jgi:DNA mismatch repair ATPase MutS